MEASEEKLLTVNIDMSIQLSISRCYSLVPRLFGEGEKRAWYLLFAHALNYLTFQSVWISPGTSVLC